MKHNMITSASGWRKVFAVSGNEEDTSPEIGEENRAISALAALTFAEYMLSKKSNVKLAVGMDTRPTGMEICTQVIKALLAKNIEVLFCGITAAPEIMAFARDADGFVYISASHNPIGHNGIKFGLNDGGVLNAQENALLTQSFNDKCEDENALQNAEKLISSCPQKLFEKTLSESSSVKESALKSYKNFLKHAVWDTKDTDTQKELTAKIKKALNETPVEIIADMNGSARTKSIDIDFLNECSIRLNTINAEAGKIAHEIIPEPENLVYCAREMERLQQQGNKACILGYMPDCDGDRGNIVYWDKKTASAQVLKAQEVFALSVLAETAFSIWSGNKSETAVCVNCPTSMRIEEIAKAFGAQVFRAEVGEANVVNLAREKRNEGWTVRILGEGSNGGNITHPSAVRDPLCTISALLKLLLIRDEETPAGLKKGLFHLWCTASGQEEKFNCNAGLRDIINTLPDYVTTGVSEERAVLKIRTEDHSVLKARFQKIFEKEWQNKKTELKSKYGITSWEAVKTNGTKEVRNISDFSQSAKGGLKIIFKDDASKPLAFIWMRGSGTEKVFRVMCDVKGNKKEEEAELLEWERQMILAADKQ